MEPSSLTLLGFGAVMVIGGVVMYLISLFSMKETSFESLLEEQKKKKAKEDKERSILNKQKRDQYKRKFEQKKKKAGTVGNGKVEKVDGGVSPMHEVQIKETPQLAAGEPVQEPKKAKGKAGKKQEPVAPPKQDSPKAQHPILKPSPEKPKKAEEPAKQVKDEPQAKTEQSKKKEARTRTVSFSDEQQPDKPKADAEQEKAKKKKKKAEPEVESTFVAQMREATLTDRDVQNILTVVRQRFGIDIGGGSKIKDLQQQLDQTKKRLAQQEAGVQKYVDRCMAAESKIEQLKQDLTLENTKFSSIEKAMNDQDNKAKQEMSMMQGKYMSEINQLKDKLAKSGDYEELRKTTEKIRADNAIFMNEIQKNAAVVSENNRLSADLQQAKMKLQETQMRCGELESKLGEYANHSDNLQKQNGDVMRQMQEQSHGMQQLQQNYAQLENEFQNVKSELQNTQSNSAKLLNQVAILSEESQGKTDLDQQLAEMQQQLSSRDSTIQDVNGKNAELQNRIKAFEDQVVQLNARIESLATEAKGQTEAASQLVQGKEELSQTQEELETVKAETAKYKEEVEKLKNKNNDLRERNWKAMDAATTLEKSLPNKIAAAKEEAAKQSIELQDSAKRILRDAFPNASSDEQDFQAWITEFASNASASSQIVQSNEPSPDLEKARREADKLRSELDQGRSETSKLQAKVQELESSRGQWETQRSELQQASDSHDQELSAAQAECNRYKNILSTTEDILSKLQSSVEVEEGLWRKKVEDAHQEASKAQQDAEGLRKTIEELKKDNSSFQSNLKEVESLQQQLDQKTTQVAELETKISSMESSSTNNGVAEQLQESDSLQCEAQVPVPVPQLDKHQQCEGTPTKTVSCQSESPVRVEYNDACIGPDPILEQQDMDGFLVIEHVNLEKERLDKEKTLTKNLGQAATKLQTVLKQTQEQLNEERNKNQELEDKLSNNTNSEESSNCEAIQTDDGTSV